MAGKLTDAKVPLSAGPLAVITAAAPFLSGMFYEPFSALISLALIVWLIWCGKKQGGLRVSWNPSLIAVSALVFFYLISGFWGVDSGMTPIGVLKFLPLPLYVLALGQLDPEQRTGILEQLPLCGVIMTAASLLLGLVPVLRSYFYAGDRLCGFFQYPNTFALYLVLGIPVLAARESWRLREYLLFLGLLAGVLLSGSRTVTVVLIGVVILYAVFGRGRQRIAIPGITLLVLGCAALYAHITGEISAIGRYLTISLSSRSFLTRLLYYRDALSAILRHPFGMGFGGYWFLQGVYQTGVYSAAHLHNDVLQFLVDVGWIPAAMLIWAVLRGFFRGDLRRRMMIGAMTAHLLLDFDMQFVAMDLILLLVIDQEPLQKEINKTFRIGSWTTGAAGALLAVFCLYFGLVSSLYYLKDYRDCANLWPGYTQAQLRLITAAEEPETMDRIADTVLKRNDCVTYAWNAKARAAFAAGDIEKMIEYKEHALTLRRYRISEYLDYADMLKQAYDRYLETGDTASAAVCEEKLRSIPARMSQTAAGTSSLGRRINESWRLTLPEEYSWLLDF